MKPSYVIGGVALVAAVAIGVLALGGGSPEADVEQEVGAGASDRGVNSGPVGPPAEPSGQLTAEIVHAELPVLDCEHPNGAVARVNDVHLQANDFCAELQKMSGRANLGVDEASLRHARALLDQLIDATLVDAALAASGHSLSAREVDAALAKLRPAGSQEPVAEVLRAQGQDPEQVRAQLQRRLAFRKLVESRGAIGVTEAEVEAEYERNPQRWRVGNSARVQPFIVRVLPSASFEEAEKLRQRAEDFTQSVRSGESPERAAAAHGVAALAPFEVAPGSGEPDLEGVAFQLGIGTWSNPVKTRAGWVVLRVSERSEGRPRSLAEARADVRALLEGQRRSSEQSRLMMELRSRAEIELLVSFAPAAVR